MNREDDDHSARDSSQAQRLPTYDEAPRQFRDTHKEDRFTGASGVLFEQAMAQTRMAICLSDPKQEDLPIVFANRAFRQLTGYEEDEIVGHNCRFLQGPNTDPEAVGRIRKAIETEDVVVVELLNYRKDGSSFWNALHLGPIYDNKGELIYFFGSQWDVSDVHQARSDRQTSRLIARELSHRMKNMFSVIGGIVSLTGRAHGAPEVGKEINQRIQALGRAYETTLDDASSGMVGLGEAIRSVMAPYDNGTNRLTLEGNGLRAPFSSIAGLGLTLHELAANAVKYGAWSNEKGEVRLDWNAVEHEGSTCIELRWEEYGGPSIETPPAGGTGTAIVQRILDTSGGSIERDWSPDGLKARVLLPVGKLK